MPAKISQRNHAYPQSVPGHQRRHIHNELLLTEFKGTEQIHGLPSDRWLAADG